MTLDCPICQSAATDALTSKHGRKVYACGNIQCQHLFTPPLSASQGVHDRPLDIERESDQSLALYRERNERLLGLFLSEIGAWAANDRYEFLDFGAGDAHISRTFKAVLQDKVEIYCVEAEEKCIPLYHKYGLKHVADLQEITSPVDFIYVIEVIEHVVDPIAVLASLRQVMKENAKIFLSTPPGHWRENLTNAYENPTHLHFFTPRSLNLALTKAGLMEMEYRFFSEMYPASPLAAKFSAFSKKNPALVAPVVYLNKGLFKLMNRIAAVFANSMGMPVAADGRPYPYHLVGFTKIMA